MSDGWLAGPEPFNPARRTFRELLEASSIGTTASGARRKAANLGPRLTGMPEEQADWDADEEPDEPADNAGTNRAGSAVRRGRGIPVTPVAPALP